MPNAVSYHPLEWSQSLANEAHAKAEDLAEICNTTNAGVGLKYGMNAQWTTIGGNIPNPPFCSGECSKLEKYILGF